MFSQLLSRSTAIFRKAFGYALIARFFATRSSFLCELANCRVSHFEGSLQYHNPLILVFPKRSFFFGEKIQTRL